jgi:ATP-binding cassette subfamily C protein LapB
LPASRRSSDKEATLLNAPTPIADLGSDAAHDPVLACLQRLAKRYDRPSAAVVLLSGLALNQRGWLPFHQAESAAERVGFRTHMKHRALKRLAKGDLPALVEMSDDKAVLLLEVKENQGLIFDPSTGAEYWCGIDKLSEGYSGRLILMEPDPARERGQDVTATRSHRDHWFWGEIRKAQGSFVFVAIAATVINLLAFAMPLFTMNVYDRIIPNKAVTSLWVLATGVALAFGFEYLVRLARAQLIDEIGRDLDAKLSQRLFEKVMNIPLSVRMGSTGAFAKRISEFDAVRDFFGSTTVVTLVDMAFVVVFLLLITYLGGWLVLVPLVGLAVMAASGLGLQREMTHSLKDAQTDAGLQHSTLVESIAGMETLKAARAEGRMLGRWRRYADMNAKTQEHLRKLTARAVNLASLAQQGISVGLVVGGFYLFDSGKITMGAIIAIVMVAGRALSPVGQVAFLLVRARQALLSLETLDKIMQAPDERALAVRSVTPIISRGHIEFQHLTFRYPEAPTDALVDISLRIEPGERIGLVGRVASGKSTLGRVLCGLYEPTGGALIIDGMDSRQHHPHEIRRTFKFVGQEAELFSGTVRDNLMLGAGDVSDEQLIAAVGRSGADIFLARDAAGFDLSVGERGQRLSGGQRGFLALARAMVEPSLMLYLDEPTGQMDTQSEQWFIDRLSRSLAPTQTLIVSTHRHAMLAPVTRLIVIDGGRILADGPKDQVLATLAANQPRSASA